MSASSSTTRIRAVLMHAPSWVPSCARCAGPAAGLPVRSAADRCERARRPRRGSPPRCVPPCSSTIFFTMASPRPVPLGLLVTYGSNTWPIRSRWKPGPLSSTVISATSASPRVASRVLDHDLAAAAAFERLDRVGEQVVQHLPQPPWSAITVVDAPDRASTVEAHAPPRVLRTIQLGHLGHQLVEVDASTSRCRGARAYSLKALTISFIASTCCTMVSVRAVEDLRVLLRSSPAAACAACARRRAGSA